MKKLNIIMAGVMTLASGLAFGSCSGNSKTGADSDSMAYVDTDADAETNAQLDSLAQIFTDPAKASATPTDTTYAVTESGLKYLIVKEGTGKAPGATDNVTVHYTGQLTNGRIFDSSYDRGEAATFPLNRVISGWTEGLQLMKEGGKAIFYIPAALGYGEAGAPPMIPGNADLVFTVELLKVDGQE